MTRESVLDLKRMDCLVMFCGMMFAVVISVICDDVEPEIEELTLCVMTFEPMESLVH